MTKKLDARTKALEKLDRVERKLAAAEGAIGAMRRDVQEVIESIKPKAEEPERTEQKLADPLG